MSTEKYKEAWEKFQNKIGLLKKKRSDIFKRISEKSDQQKLESLREKLNKNEQGTTNN